MLTARRIADQVRAGDLDPIDVLEQALQRLAVREEHVRAYLDPDVEFARRMADVVVERLNRGEDPGRLAGVPVSLKDNIAVAGRSLTAGSRALEGYRAPHDSCVAERLIAEGAVLLGRTNLDEFGMGASTESSGFHATLNPWDRERVPGGSSGGSAAAVAAGIVPLALGTETGGSIRQPAALCGVTGFKPSYGAVSRRGVVAFGSSLDQVGPIAAHAEDAALLYDVIAGHDPLDSTSAPGERASALSVRADLEGLRIGIPEEFLDERVDKRVLQQIEKAVQVLGDAGAITKRIPRGRLAHMQHSIAVYHLVACSEASTNLARFDGVRFGPRVSDGHALWPLYEDTRGTLFGPEVRRRIVLGTFALSAGHADAWYRRALSVRALIRREFQQLFDDYDLLAGPTSPFGAFPLGEKLDDPVAMSLCDLLTAPACLAGLPSVSVPCGLVRKGSFKGLPVGLCLTGAQGDDPRVLAAARAFEVARGEPERSPLWELEA
ncbi:MAG: glutamyl-tRNA(Gln) amidotransferase subunit A [Planctomycetota bacterium]|nr:MAG: glutamyl-tRNA(Gln) amidotransferase subunit A [Planctomycetota bacterium]